jgi:hypothetical protein
VLASLVIEEARTLPNTTVTFFYCKYGDESRNSFLAVARGVLSQVLSSEKSNNILLYVDEKASSSGETVLSSSKLAKELLETIFQSCKKTYIILDGLDECDRGERKEIATWFRQLVDGLPQREMDTIRCLFVSQDDGFARKDLSMLPSIKLTMNSNKSDIETYAKVWHQRIEERFGPLDLKKLNIANIVTARAQGDCHLSHFRPVQWTDFFRHVPVRKIGRAEPLQPDIAQKAYRRDAGKISSESRRSVSKKTNMRERISNVFTATQG